MYTFILTMYYIFIFLVLAYIYIYLLYKNIFFLVHIFIFCVIVNIYICTNINVNASIYCASGDVNEHLSQRVWWSFPSLEWWIVGETIVDRLVIQCTKKKNNEKGEKDASLFPPENNCRFLCCMVQYYYTYTMQCVFLTICLESSFLRNKHFADALHVTTRIITI